MVQGAAAWFLAWEREVISGVDALAILNVRVLVIPVRIFLLALYVRALRLRNRKIVSRDDVGLDVDCGDFLLGLPSRIRFWARKLLFPVHHHVVVGWDSFDAKINVHGEDEADRDEEDDAQGQQEKGMDEELI